MVDPFRDELAGKQAITTASVESVRSLHLIPTVRQRDYTPVELLAEPDEVTHLPLYFEDTFEDCGSDDGQFAWTGMDYWHLFYWRGRFLFDIVAFPVNAVVTPPWTVMESDGRLSRRVWGCDFDSKRSAEPAANEPVEADSTGG